MSEQDDLVSVYQAANAVEAYMVKNMLLEEGIEAFVSEENEPLVGLPIAAPDVLVAGKDEARARAIVGEHERQQIARAERPDWTCPKCGATVIGALDHCDSCGAPRPGTEDDDAVDAEEDQSEI
jgi:hypothetical protein